MRKIKAWQVTTLIFIILFSVLISRIREKKETIQPFNNIDPFINVDRSQRLLEALAEIT